MFKLCQINIHKFKEKRISYNDGTGDAYYAVVCERCNFERTKYLAGILYHTPFISKKEKNKIFLSYKYTNFLYHRKKILFSEDMYDYLCKTEGKKYANLVLLSSILFFVPGKFLFKKTN